MSYSQILSQDAYPADALYRSSVAHQPRTPSPATIASRKAATVPEGGAQHQQSAAAAAAAPPSSAACQVVVPSMSALVPLASTPFMGYYPQAYCQVPPSYMTHHHHHHQQHQHHHHPQRMLPTAVSRSKLNCVESAYLFIIISTTALSRHASADSPHSRECNHHI